MKPRLGICVNSLSFTAPGPLECCPLSGGSLYWTLHHTSSQRPPSHNLLKHFLHNLLVCQSEMWNRLLIVLTWFLCPPILALGYFLALCGGFTNSYLFPLSLGHIVDKITYFNRKTTLQMLKLRPLLAWEYKHRWPPLELFPAPATFNPFSAKAFHCAVRSLVKQLLVSAALKVCNLADVLHSGLEALKWWLWVTEA